MPHIPVDRPAPAAAEVQLAATPKTALKSAAMRKISPRTYRVNPLHAAQHLFGDNIGMDPDTGGLFVRR